MNMLSNAGLNAEQSQKAVDALRGVMTDTITSHYPAVAQPVLDQLLEGARAAFGTGIAQTMLLMAGVMLFGGAVAWFGMRKTRE
jgi:hypothetical protein